MAKFLLDTPLFEEFADGLELSKAGSRVRLCQIVCLSALSSGFDVLLDEGGLGVAACSVQIEGSLHAEPVLDTEVCVYLCDVLDKESSI